MLLPAQVGKHWTVRMQEQEICARKLASAHPGLFLRNLPMLSSSLRGRTRLEFVVFRSVQLAFIHNNAQRVFDFGI